MLTRLTVVAAVALSVTACGASKDDKIVLRDLTMEKKEYTYAQWRDEIANSEVLEDPIDCAELLKAGEAEGKPEYPEGKALYLEACEEGKKIRLNRKPGKALRGPFL